MLQTTFALIYVFASNVPYVAMAQQSVSRPGAGVSNLPLEVTHFDAPGFGELADAVNLVNGNLYVEGSSLSRNNQSDTGSFGADQWQLSSTMRLAGYSRGMATLPDRLSLVTGDGATMDFARATPDYLSVPSWIKRYQTATGTTFYRSQPIPGTTYSAEWMVLVKRNADTIAHYYTRAGTRLTFFRDGEYLDYTQSQTQQFRAASAPFSSSEGDATNTPRTEFNYTTPVGRISSIVDEYGRTTSYTWNADGLVKIAYLSDQAIPWRSTSFTYATLNLGNGSSVNTISSMTFTASETGTTTTASRTTNFEYSVVALPNNGRKILLTAVKRPTPVGQTATRYGYEVGGTRICAVEEFRDGAGVTPTCAGTGTGTLRTTYTYATSSTYGGVQVTVVKSPKVGAAKTTVYSHDLTGRLRQRDETDANPDANTSAVRSWKYGYLRNGSLGSLEEPSGKTTHYVYDDRGNLLKTKTYGTATANPQIAILGDVRLAAPVTELIAGQTVRIGAFARSDASTQGLAWTASIGNITADGTYTAPAPLNGATSVTLTAQSKAVPSIIGQVTLPLRAITITPKVPTTALNVGETIGLSAIVDNDLATAGVTWSASTGTPVKTTNGWTYTAPSSASSVTLTATSVSDPTRTAAAVITVKPVTLTLRAPAASDTTLTAGTAQKLRFAAALEGVNGSNAVTWSLTGPGTLSSDGLYTAPSAITAGTSAIVKATAVADSSKTSSATVNLIPPTMTEILPNFYGAAPVQFVIGVKNDTNNADVTWSVTSGGGTINSSGYYTPPTLAVGTSANVTIRATSNADSRVFKERTGQIVHSSESVLLSAQTYKTIRIVNSYDVTDWEVYPGQTIQLSARVPGLKYENSFAWSIVSGGGSVSSTGLYTAPSVFSNSSIMIRASSVLTPNRSGMITLIVKQPVVTIYGSNAMLGSSSMQLAANTQFDFLGNGVAPVTWSLSGSGTLSSTGMYTRAAFPDSGAVITATTTSGASGTLTISGLTSGAFGNRVLGPKKYVPGTKISFGYYFPYSNGAVTWTTTAGTITSYGILTLPITQTANGIIVTATQGVNKATETLNNISYLNSGYNSKDAISGSFLPRLTTFFSQPMGTIERSDKIQLNAIFQGDLLNRGAVWSLTPNCGCGIIDSNGLFTALAPDGSPTSFPGSVRSASAIARSVAFPDRSLTLTFNIEKTILLGTVYTAIDTNHLIGRNYQMIMDNYTDFSNRDIIWKSSGTGQALVTSSGVYRTNVFPAPNNVLPNVYIEGTRGSYISQRSLQYFRIILALKTSATTVSPAGTVPFSVGLDNDNSNAGVTYAVTTGPGSVSSSGVYTAPASVVGAADIPVTITATSVTDPLIKGSVTITLSPIKVSVTGSSTVSSGKSLALGYRVENDRAGTGVTWSTSAGTVDVNGVFTAPAVATDTNVTVTATSKSDTTKTFSLTVSVKAPRVLLANPVPNGETLNDGSTVSIGAAVLNGTGAATFAVNNGSVTASGGYTLPAPLTSGTATITSSLVGGIGATTSLAYAPFAEPGEASAAAYRQQTYAYDTDHQVTAATVPATDSAGGVVAYSYTETSLKSEYVYATAVTVSGQSFTYPTTVTRKTMLGTTEQFRTVDVYDAEGLVTESRRETPNASEQRKTVFTYKRTTGTRGVYRDQLTQTEETGTGGLTRTTELTMDALGRVTLQKETDVIAGVNQATGADETQSRTTTRSYNGFDQMLSQSVGVGASQPESKQGLAYFPSGELKSSWQGTPDNLTTFAYHAVNTGDAGRLSTVTRGEGTSGAISKTRETTVYAYDSFGRAITTTLDGNITTRQFDTMDRVVSETQPDSGSLKTRYDISGAVLQLTSLDPISNTSLRVSSTNDAFGRATSVVTEDTSAGATTSYSITTNYDPYDRPIRMTDNRLADVGVTGDAPSSYMKYDPFGRLLAQLGPQLSGNTAPGYSDNRRPYMEYVYDVFGRKTKESKLLRSPNPVTPTNLVMPTDGTAGVEVASSVTSYDAWNRVKQSIDAESYLTFMTYDPAGNVKLKEQQVCRDPTGECIDQFSDEDGGNNLYASTKYAYDHAARVVKTTDARGNVSRVRYNDLGLPSSVMDARGVTVKVMRYTKDGLLTGVFEPDTSTTAATYITSDDFTGDPSAYVKTKTLNYGGSRKYPTTQCDANMNKNSDVASCGTLEFDYAGRSTKTYLPDGISLIEQSYNTRGQLTKLKDADGFETLYKYDAFGQMTEEKKPPRAGNTTDSGAFPAGFTGLVNAYAYDKMGNLTQKTERGMVTKYAYNSLGKVQAETKPKMGAISANNKLYTYRVDGAKTAETTYDYAGSLASSGFNTVTCSGLNTPNVTSGNAQCWELSKLGRASVTASFGVSSAVGGGAYTRERFQKDEFNGLGLRFKRSFYGDASIYAAHRTINGVLSGTGEATLWRFDANGNLTQSYKRGITTPNNTYTDGAITDSSLASDVFKYTFSPTNQEISRNSRIRTWVSSQTRPLVNLEVASTGERTGQAAPPPGTATPQSTTSVTPGIGGYTKRDQLKSVTVSDRDAKGNEVSRRTDYEYYADGSKSRVVVYNPLASDAVLGEQTFSYDARGRQTSSSDSNDGATTTTAYGADGSVTESLTNGNYLSLRKPTIGGLTASITANAKASFNGCPTTATACSVQNSTMMYTPNGMLLTLKQDSSIQTGAATATDSTTTTYTFDEHGNNTEQKTPTATVYSATYNALNAMTTESKLNQNGVTVSSTYSLNSRGMRLLMSGSDSANPLNGASKRYDAEDRAADFNATTTRAANVNGAGTLDLLAKTQQVLLVRYDPAGNMVLNVSGKINETVDGSNNYTDEQSIANSTVFLNNSVHFMHSLAYAYVFPIYKSVFGYVMGVGSAVAVVNQANRDETFGLTDGVRNENPTYSIYTPFAATPAITLSSTTPLAAPITPLSSQVRVEPSAIQAPDNAPPSSDPSAITAPSSPAQPSTTAGKETGFSSSASLTNTSVSSQSVSAPTVGVQSFSISSATTTTSSSTTQPAPSKPVSSQPAAFSSQINLEPPSSVLPPSITPLSASSIVAPSGFTPVLPASGDVSSIVAPGSSSVPIVGATPSSGTGTIVPPSSSVVPPSGSSGGIVRPGGGSSVAVKPLFYYEGENGGVCDSDVQYSEIVDNGVVRKPQQCLRPRNIDAYNKSRQLESEAKTGGDSVSRGKAREEVEFRDAQILAGYVCYKEGGGSESARGNCKDYVARMRESPMYKSIGSSPAMWVNMQGDLIAGRLGRERLEALTWAFEHTKFERRGNTLVLMGVGRNGEPANITFPSYLLAMTAQWGQVRPVGGGGSGVSGWWGMFGGALARAGAIGALISLGGDSAPWYDGMSSDDAVRIAGLIGTLFDDNSKQAKGNASSQAGSQAASGSPDPNDPCDPNHRSNGGASARNRESDHAFDRRAEDGRVTADQASRILRDGKQFSQSDGRTLFVLGGDVAVVDPVTGAIITYLDLTRQNIQDRIESGRWSPC